MLDRWKGFIALMTSRGAMLVWLLVVLVGASSALQNLGALSDHSQGLFSLSNLPWLFVSLTGMKLLHEMGHAFVCKRYGGEVHAFGVMFLIMTPLPYVDTASTWGFKSRFQRAIVSAAGMMVELFLAAIGALVWSHTSAGIVNSLAYNVMVVGSVSSLLFNGNPLLRFDAYYILADLVDIPNLYQKAQQHWMYLGDRYVLGSAAAESPATTHRGAPVVHLLRRRRLLLPHPGLHRHHPGGDGPVVLDRHVHGGGDLPQPVHLAPAQNCTPT